MRILVDADACPVKEVIVSIAKSYKMEVVFIVNYNHCIKDDDYSEILIVDNESQSVDIALINKAKPNDIVITNDYGLADMSLGKRCFCISNSGYIYTKDNIDGLLFRRHLTMKLKKRKNFKFSKIKKRNNNDDERFRENLIKLIKDNLIINI